MREPSEAVRDAGSTSGAAPLTAETGMILAVGGTWRIVPRRWVLSREGPAGAPSPDAGVPALSREGPAGAPSPDAGVPGTILPLAKWLELKTSDADLAGVGVLVGPADDPAQLRPFLGQIQVIALEFPRFQDGRGYSHARRLRHFWGYAGHLVAVGDVLRDQILWMSRVGIDAFHLRADQDPAGCLRAFALYSAFYQYQR